MLSAAESAGPLALAAADAAAAPWPLTKKRKKMAEEDALMGRMLEQGANFHAIGAAVGKYEYLLKYRYIYVCTYICIHMYLYLYLYLCLYLETYMSHGTDAGAGGQLPRYRRVGWKVRIFIEISISICMHI